MCFLQQLVVFVVFTLMLNTVKASCHLMRGGVSKLCLQNRQGRLFIAKDIRESAIVFVEFGTLDVVLFESRHE